MWFALYEPVKKVVKFINVHLSISTSLFERLAMASPANRAKDRAFSTRLPA
jgi:hypothetical protein